MNQEQSYNKKSILRDPCAVFSRLYSDRDNHKLEYLSELEKQYRAHKKQRKQIQQRTRLVSKKIGEAKRSRLPIDTLKTEMQEHTSQAKAVEDDKQ